MKKAIVILLVICMLSSLLVSCGHEHKFGGWYPTTSSTCTQKGVERRDCSCGEYETREMNLLEHSYDEWEIVENATCISEGKQKKKCLTCGYVYEEGIPQSTTHDYTDLGCRSCGKFKYNIVVGSLPITVYDSEFDNTITVTSVDLLAVDTYGHSITINVYASSTKGGAGFIVAIAGKIMLMPGLGAHPAAEKIDLLSDGTIVGLS